jgi:hypothetical protein
MTRIYRPETDTGWRGIEGRLRRTLGGIAVAVLVAGACGPARTTATPSRSNAAEPTSGPSGAPAPSSTPVAAPKVRAQKIASVVQPVGMAVRPGDDALYIVGKKGRVWALRDGRVDPKPVLDLSGRVSDGNEQGLL